MHVSVLSYNIHKGFDWASTRSTIHLLRYEIQQLHSDILLLQEIKGSQFLHLAENFWPHFSYGKNAVSPQGHYGNAILSKFPIQYTENLNLSMSKLEKRGLLHAVVLVAPQGPPLHVLTLHLGLFLRYRNKQIEKIVTFIKNRIPEEEAIILGGDFNDWTNAVTIPLIEELGFKEAFYHGTTTGYAKTYPSWAPTLRLDRIYCRYFNILATQRLLQWRHLSDHLAIEAHLKPTVDLLSVRKFRENGKDIIR